MILGTELQAIVYGVDSKANWYRKLVESYTTRLNWEPSKKCYAVNDEGEREGMQ